MGPSKVDLELAEALGAIGQVTAERQAAYYEKMVQAFPRTVAYIAITHVGSRCAAQGSIGDEGQQGILFK